MPLDENEYRLLGFTDLDGPELYDLVGKRCGKSPACIELKHLTSFDNRGAIGSL
jgi:hypothetical protein